MTARAWTDAEERRLRHFYPDIVTPALARGMGRSIPSINGKAGALGLRKSAAFFAAAASGRLRGDRGGAFRFAKGHTPWNKGRKGLSLGGMATRFQKGNRPHTWRPVGSERWAEGYLQRKVTDTGYTPRDWRQVHVMLWEAEHGPVPQGHAVVFLDGDRRNIRLENLELVSRAELMRRNSIHNLPPALKEVIQLRGRLNRRIRRMSDVG